MYAAESKTEHGLFWVSNDEDKKLWGTLQINEINEARVETFGSLIGTREENPQTIVGLIKGGQQAVTLLNCFPINTRHAVPALDGELDWSHQTCLVNVVLEGLALQEDQQPDFAAAMINISTLPKWVNPNILDVKPTKTLSGSWKIGITLKDRADESIITTFREKRIKIGIWFNAAEQSDSRGPITKYSAEDNCLLSLEAAEGERLHLDDITGITAAIQDLLTVCCNETSVVTSVHVKHEQKDEETVKVFRRMKGYKVEKKGDNAHPSLNFQNIGGMKGIAKWLEKTEEYHPATAVLTSNWYNDTGYGSDKLSRTYTAVEGLQTRKNSRKKANMNVRQLAEFVDQAIPNFDDITNSNAKDWATKVKNVRDKTIAHLDPIGAPTTDGLALLRMSDVLYVAGTSFLLRKVGLGEPEIQKYIQGCYQSGLLGYKE